MLRRLSVSNYILIDSLEIEFDPRLNIITGETGAGKSILLGALGLLLGNKNEGAALRDTQRNCVIEGVFDIAAYGLRPFFEANDLDYADEAVVRRILTPAGKSRAYINDLPVQLAQLREFGSRLIDIHSQHQNLILASEEFRTEALDTVAGNGELRAAYRAKYERLQELQRTCARLRAEADAARRDEEWLRYQSEELTAARLRAGEVAELEAEQAVLANADRIGEAITAVRNAFDGDEIGVLAQVKNAEVEIGRLGGSYPHAADLSRRLRSVLEELKDIAATLAEDGERIETNPERLQKVDDRLNTLYSLCQKHRAADEGELIALRDRYAAQLDAITHSDEELAALQTEIGAARNEAELLASELHRTREQAAPVFAGQIVATLVRLFKKNLSVPVDFHTHCTPGYGLASVLSAILAGADIVDTNCWYFAEGTGAPAIELIYVFCKKLGIELQANMEAVAKINGELKEIRRELELSVFGAEKPAPKAFDPLTDTLPAEIDAEFDKAIAAAKAGDEAALLAACHRIEAHFGFPAPNELVKNAEIPGGMYSNMVAQLKQLKAEEILPRAMELIPTVRLAAGLPPLVTPTSQIVGAQAVACAMDEKAGRPMYTTKSSQFVGLVKGEYGKTPVAIDPEFRLKIAGVREETPYDTSKYQMQPNPELPEAGGVKLAENEKEVELFPMVAKTYLTGVKVKAYEAKKAAEAPKAETKAEEAPVGQPITGNTVNAPLPGRILEIKVKVGDSVKAGQEIAVLEAMKMENSIVSDYAGTVKQILVKTGDNVQTDAALIEVE